MRCALYIRVSTEEQAKEGFSIAAQKNRLLAYCESQEWDAVGFYVDEGESAKDLNRTNLKRMLKDIEEGFIDVVLVYRLDRLTRSVLDLYQLLEKFEKHNCKFKSATEVYDTTTAIGRLFITLVAALAQWERENLGERVRMGMTQKVKQGEWHGSTPPIGYYYADGKLMINEDEARIVRKIFDLYLSGLSDRKIAIKLNEEGIPNNSDKEWQEQRVRYILINPIYQGDMQWGVRVNKDDYFTVKDSAPPIVTREVFEQAQKIRESRRRFRGKQSTSNYIFTGILTCSRCGTTFKGHMTRRDNGLIHKSYRCRNVLVNKCDMPMMSQKMIEHNFLKYLKKLDLENFTQKAINKEKNTRKQEREIERLKNQLIQIKNRRKKWQYAWADGTISDEDFKNRMNEEQLKEQEIIDELNKLDVQTENHIDEDAIKILSNALKNWEHLDDLEKKQLMQLTVDKIYVDKVDAPRLMDRVEIKEIIFN